MNLTDESDHKAVITTRFVLDAGSLITDIVYDDNGDWLFFGDEEVSDYDTRIVSIKEILEQDESLRHLPDMQPGQAISRNDIDSPWKMMR